MYVNDYYRGYFAPIQEKIHLQFIKMIEYNNKVIMEQLNLIVRFTIHVFILFSWRENRRRFHHSHTTSRPPSVRKRMQYMTRKHE